MACIKFNNISNQPDSGFSIIELSIVLTIIALIASSALAIGASRIESARINSTKDRMEFIMEAFELYVKNYRYLPCPADNSLSVTDNNFGNGEGSGTGDINPDPCTQENDIEATSNVLIGGIPTQHLNISPAIVVDGWGRRFSYVVDEDLTWEGVVGGPDGFINNTGGIIVLNNEGGAILTNDGAMLIISYGTNGHGAWVGKGGIQLDKGCGIDASEDENTNICPGFNETFVQKFRTAAYDDMVEYRVKWHFDY